MIFSLLLLGVTFILNLKFLAYRELWPAGKNDPSSSWKGSKKPGPNMVKVFMLLKQHCLTPPTSL